MKPIGIGQLAKAKPKSMTRHDFGQGEEKVATKAPMPLPDPTPMHDDSAQDHKVPLERVVSTQATDEQEGQLSVDMIQNDHELILVAPVAGTPPDQVHVSITDDVITIKGRREFPIKELVADKDVYLEECFWGNFSRSIILPAAVDLNRVEARFKNNVLTIRIPKTERVRSRVIRIEE